MGEVSKQSLREAHTTITNTLTLEHTHRKTYFKQWAQLSYKHYEHTHTTSYRCNADFYHCLGEIVPNSN